MVDHAVEVLQSIWRWLVFGALVSTLIAVALPEGGLAMLEGGGGILAALNMLVISAPLYVCATASVPIAASLVAGGMPTSAALVFAMAGPATMWPQLVPFIAHLALVFSWFIWVPSLSGVSDLV